MFLLQNLVLGVFWRVFLNAVAFAFKKKKTSKLCVVSFTVSKALKVFLFQTKSLNFLYDSELPVLEETCISVVKI